MSDYRYTKIIGLTSFNNVSLDTTGCGENTTVNVFWKGLCTLCFNETYESVLHNILNSYNGYYERKNSSFGLTSVDKDFMELYTECKLSKILNMHFRDKKLKRIINGNRNTN